MAELNRALPELLMRRDGTVTADGVARPLRVEKRFVFRPRSIDVYYRLTNPGPADVIATFGVEINVSLAARSAENGRLFLLDEDRKTEISSDAAEIDGVQGLLVHDVRNEVSVTLSSVRAFRCWSVPLETRSGSGDGGAARVPVALLRAALGRDACKRRKLGKSPERRLRENPGQLMRFGPVWKWK